VIYLESARNQLSPLEQFGLMVLVDLSGLLPVASPSQDVVSLQLSNEPALQLDQPPVFRGTPGIVSLARATLSLVGSVSGAVVEQESTAQDKHGRVPSEVNAMVAAGKTQSPWVNAVARAFRDAVLTQAGDRPVRTVAPWPGGHRWAAAFTHDLDVVRHWPLFTGLRLLELAKKGEVGQALRVSGGALMSAIGDPIGAGVREILAIEREHSISATWFVIAGVPSLNSTLKGDVTYSVESPRTRNILAAIATDGHEIGLHGSFATYQDAGIMSQERERLRRVTGAAVLGVRQHFLRMRPGSTHRAMREAGFAYDSTYGFPDRNGFRLGAAAVVPGWDNRAGRQAEPEEAPLAWMDRALSKYRGIEIPSRWVDEGLELARIAESEEGLWVGLWHPNLTRPLGFPGAVEEFRRLVQMVQSRRPFVAPLQSIIEWRKARRSLVARSVSPTGVSALGAGTTAAWPVVLEDGRGNIREQFPWPVAA
jgi:peptidoglycan/xylan/chitin deacetylase (PgdA/CDA1 family)